MRLWIGIVFRMFFRVYRFKNCYYVIKEVNFWDKNFLQYDLLYVVSKMRMVIGDVD